jgi:hypothetical protein
VTALISAAAFLLLLLALARRPQRTAQKTQREVAQGARLDTYTPQSQDRLWDDWYGHHGGGG